MAANSNTAPTTDEIITVSVSGANHQLVTSIVDALRKVDGYATDNIVLAEDTRRNIGHLGCRYSTMVFHA